MALAVPLPREARGPTGRSRLLVQISRGVRVHGKAETAHRSHQLGFDKGATVSQGRPPYAVAPGQLEATGSEYRRFPRAAQSVNSTEVTGPNVTGKTAILLKEILVTSNLAKKFFKGGPKATKYKRKKKSINLTSSK